MDNKSSTSDGAPMTLDPASGGSLQPMPPLEALSEVVVMPDPEALAREAAQRFSELVREAAGSRGRFLP